MSRSVGSTGLHVDAEITTDLERFGLKVFEIGRLHILQRVVVLDVVLHIFMFRVGQEICECCRNSSIVFLQLQAGTGKTFIYRLKGSRLQRVTVQNFYSY